jgi:hypothetical protein
MQADRPQVPASPLDRALEHDGEAIQGADDTRFSATAECKHGSSMF